VLRYSSKSVGSNPLPARKESINGRNCVSGQALALLRYLSCSFGSTSRTLEVTQQRQPWTLRAKVRMCEGESGYEGWRRGLFTLVFAAPLLHLLERRTIEVAVNMNLP